MAQKPVKRMYTEEEVQERENRLKERWAKIQPQQSADYERIMTENETTIRDNSNMDATLKAIGKHTSNANDKVVWLFTNFHTDFLTVDNFIDHFNTPKRNWPLIIIASIALVGGALILSREQDFALWYGTGYNWAIFWGILIGGLVGYRFYRNRQKKNVQTGNI